MIFIEMAGKMHVLVGSMIFCSLLLSTTAIECFYCESVYDPACGEHFDSEEYFKIDCDMMAPPRYLEKRLASVNATGCMKQIFKEHTTIKYIRSCYFGNINNTEIGCQMDPALPDIRNEQCFVCNDEDYCNTATWSNRIDPYYTLLSLVVMALVAKLLNLQTI